MPETEEGYQFLDLIEICGRQLKTSFGGIIGVDLNAWLDVARIKNYNIPAMMEFVKDFEKGMLAGISSTNSE